MKAYKKMKKLQKVVILKSSNKNFINMQDLFQIKYIDINKIIEYDKVSSEKK